MRLLGKQEIEDIAIGAAVLGTGGGGDPYIGKLMALQAVEEFGPVPLIKVDEISDDALVIPSSGMGAPTVGVEKIPNGDEAVEAFLTLEKYLGKKIDATFPIEAGGGNSMLPLATAARLRLPVVDVDGMGRAFPELQMVTFHLEGVSISPFVLRDEKGNSVLLETIDNNWAEKIARAVTVEMGGTAKMASYSMLGRNLKESGIKGIVTLSERIGRALRLAQTENMDPIKEILKLTNGFELFKGKIVDIERKTQTGFARGSAKIEGLFNYKGSTMDIRFQNEHLLAKVDDHLVCSTPDLIAVMDMETGYPVTTEGLRYGVRCIVIGMPCDHKWRTQKGLATVGPRYFGYDVEYVPVEDLKKQGLPI